ncbi:hypothetical protein BDN70DRAFT_889192 [Pholiota conissans]|uniref:Uncharacterized protein n=1 Tax=Pholiota conissans TaxID=109636 RepID=A0A9P5YLY5_9AGAR|nr:hypothetical protein BDN70DRAFT_889192 [Pholiota conissans]
MADERTMSVITMLNTAQRNRQHVSTVIAMAQIRGYYMKAKPRRTRKSAHALPILKFFEVERILRTIEDGDVRPRSVNYDESDEEDSDEEETTCTSIETLTDSVPPSCPLLDVVDDAGVDFDLACDEVQDILAESEPLAKKGKKRELLTDIVSLDSDVNLEEAGGAGDSLELGAWF